ncbi:MAG: 3-keto-disaccharide hydrolase [Segetibacter sp.]
MRNISIVVSLVILVALSAFVRHAYQKKMLLFNGKNFNGWEGDTTETWRIENGSIAGGSLDKTVPHNNFIVTKREYGNFILRLKFKLIGKEGFVNAGVQFNSQRLTNPAYEMAGYQADLGDKYWASLYDETRRNKTLVQADSLLIAKLLKREDWNDYEIRSRNGRIQLFLNNKQTVDYTETDKTIPQSGHIGLQIHGGGKAIVYYKDIVLEEVK